MEEFDFDLNNEIGTTVSQLKSKSNPMIETNIDTKFNYDKVIEHYNSEQPNTIFNYDTNRDTIINTMSNTLTQNQDIQSIEKMSNTKQNTPYQMNENRPIKQQNMNSIVRDLENNLDNFGKVNLNEPLPVNFTKSMIPKQIPKKKPIEFMSNEPKKSEPIKEQTIVDIIRNFFRKIEFKEVIITMLLFIVLNNKIIIEMIYEKIPYVKIIQSPYPNLIIRTIIFGIILIIIKNLIFKK
jgi:hypothetical protein